MSCNCNQQTNYNICNPAPCQEPQDCSCPTILSTDCVTYGGNDLECSGIVAGQTLTETIEQLDTFICEKVDDITNALTLKNIGDGAKVYKGDDLLGRKELRTVTKTGNLVTVTENTNDIAVSIDESALNTFIEANQKTYSVDNVGTGVEVYKDSTVVGDNTQFNFRTVVQEDQGTGESFLRDIQQTTDELKVRVKTLVSPTLSISSTDEEVTISLPDSATIPALYVNNLYVPTYQEWVNAGGDLITNSSFLYKGEGTLSKPFTDSINYTSTVAYTITANTSIQNALDAYVGSGTRLAPERSGEQIIVQDNNSFYTFSGDFGYSNIKLKLQTTIVSTISGYVLDADNPLHFNNVDSAIIELDTNGILQIQGLGFNNSGSNVATSNLVDAKTITLIGEGRIECLSNTNPLTRYIINSDVTETGNNNDGSITFDIRCFISATYQGIYNVKGNSRIDIYGRLQSGNVVNAVNVALKAFNQEEGTVRKFNTSSIAILGGTRTNGITFTPNVLYNTTYSNNGGTYEGSCTNLFNKLNTEDVSFTVVSTENGTNITVTNIFESPNLWLLTFRNNVFATGLIDFTKVDLTLGNNISSINTIGNNIVESLTIHADRAAALLAGRPLYSAYLKTSGVAYPTTTGWVRDIVLPA